MAVARIWTFTDPYHYQATVRAADVEITVAARGQFRAELTQIDFSRLWIQRGLESLSRIARLAYAPQRAPINFPIGPAPSAMRHAGLELSTGDIILPGMGSVAHNLMLGSAGVGSMSLTPEDLAKTSHMLTGREITANSTVRLVRPNPAHLSRLLMLHDAAGQLAKGAPETLARPEVARSLENALVHAMITCLTEGTPVPLGTTARQRMRVMARFEELLAQNTDRPLYLAEVCAATAVSERSLQAICQNHLGMGPMRYLLLRRMHMAHRALLLADPASRSVTDVATAFGFWELGRFAVEHRELFGETPLASLRRVPMEVAARGSPFELAAAGIR